MDKKSIKKRLKQLRKRLKKINKKKSVLVINGNQVTVMTMKIIKNPKPINLKKLQKKYITKQ